MCLLWYSQINTHIYSLHIPTISHPAYGNTNYYSKPSNGYGTNPAYVSRMVCLKAWQKRSILCKCCFQLQLLPWLKHCLFWFWFPQRLFLKDRLTKCRNWLRYKSRLNQPHQITVPLQWQDLNVFPQCYRATKWDVVLFISFPRNRSIYFLWSQKILSSWSWISPQIRWIFTT